MLYSPCYSFMQSLITVTIVMHCPEDWTQYACFTFTALTTCTVEASQKFHVTIVKKEKGEGLTSANFENTTIMP